MAGSHQQHPYNTEYLNDWSINQEKALLDELYNPAKGSEISVFDYPRAYYKDVSANIEYSNECLSDPVAQMENIKQELILNYRYPRDKDTFEDQIRKNKTYYFKANNKSYPSPRATYLIWQYNKLAKKCTEPEETDIHQIKESDGSIWQQSQQLTHELWNTVKQGLSVLKDKIGIVKSFVGVIDDIWFALFPPDNASAITAISSPTPAVDNTAIVVGGVTAAVHIFEGINGLWIAIKSTLGIIALDKQLETAPEKKKAKRESERVVHISNIFTGIGTAITSAIGFGLSMIAIVFNKIAFATVSSVLLPVHVLWILGRRFFRFNKAEMDYFNKRYEETIIPEPQSDLQLTLAKMGMPIDIEKTGEYLDLQAAIPAERDKIKCQLNNFFDPKASTENLDFRKLSHDFFTLDHKLSNLERAEEKYKEERSSFVFSSAELFAALAVSIFICFLPAYVAVAVTFSCLVEVAEYVDERYPFLGKMGIWFNDSIATPIKSFFAENPEKTYPSSAIDKKTKLPDITPENQEKWNAAIGRSTNNGKLHKWFNKNAKELEVKAEVLPVTLPAIQPAFFQNRGAKPTLDFTHANLHSPWMESSW